MAAMPLCHDELLAVVRFLPFEDRAAAAATCVALAAAVRDPSSWPPTVVVTGVPASQAWMTGATTRFEERPARSEHLARLIIPAGPRTLSVVSASVHLAEQVLPLEHVVSALPLLRRLELWCLPPPTEFGALAAAMEGLPRLESLGVCSAMTAGEVGILAQAVALGSMPLLSRIAIELDESACPRGALETLATGFSRAMATGVRARPLAALRMELEEEARWRQETRANSAVDVCRVAAVLLPGLRALDLRGVPLCAPDPNGPQAAPELSQLVLVDCRGVPLAALTARLPGIECLELVRPLPRVSGGEWSQAAPLLARAGLKCVTVSGCDAILDEHVAALVAGPLRSLVLADCEHVSPHGLAAALAQPGAVLETLGVGTDMARGTGEALLSVLADQRLLRRLTHIALPPLSFAVTEAWQLLWPLRHRRRALRGLDWAGSTQHQRLALCTNAPFPNAISEPFRCTASCPLCCAGGQDEEYWRVYFS